MSGLARYQLNRLSDKELTEIMSFKTRYYNLMAENLRGIEGIKILWPELPAGIIPFCLSMFIESGRDGIFERMRAKYDVMAWPTLPMAVIDRLDEYPDVELPGRKLFQINLPADRVVSAGFPAYTERLLRDLRDMMKGKV
jgi:hypothetical protein